MVKVRDELPQTPTGFVDLSSWKKRVLLGATADFEQALDKACELLVDESLLNHSDYQLLLKKGLSIAEVLANLHLDPQTFVSAMIVPFVEQGLLSKEIIAKKIDPQVAKLIVGVALIEEVQARSEGLPKSLAQRSRDKLRRLLLAVVDDIRVVLIKLAERLYVLKMSHNLAPEARRSLAMDTRDIYAPLANRLGIGQLKWELEDLAFRVLEPEAYKKIAQLLDERRQDRDKYIQTVVGTIEEALAKIKIHAEIIGRAKHIFSIWRKMSRKNIDFKEIYDVRAVRILVETVSDCYAALGIVHTMWKHIPKEFDDYIATPKGNGYRSLHTAVVGPGAKNLEIQIRTFEMHQEAELGFAAHWLYKEGSKQDQNYQTKIAAMRQLLDWQDEIGSQVSEEEPLNLELFEDRVYVFTPKGEVIDLPEGSTPLDFAYHVHTELGHRCRGAKVNHSIVSLNTALNSGDQIEILATKIGAPSRDWLNPHLGYLRSTRAKAKVLQWFKRQSREQHLDQGKALLERELKRLDLGQPDLTKLASKLHFKNTDELFIALGNGDLRLNQILQVLDPGFDTNKEKPDTITTSSSIAKSKQQFKSNILVHGIGNLLSQFAKCCKPVPGDPIVGYITVGRGVSIHRQDCVQALQIQEDGQPSRLIQVSWGEAVDHVYPVDISIKAYDRQGLLRDITSVLSQEKVNVLAVKTMTDPNDNLASMGLRFEINSLEMLERVMTRIQQVPNVLEVQRVKQ